MAKATRKSILLVAGVGIQDDVHSGPTVRHRAQIRRGAERPNLRQVHLLAGELHDELFLRGFAVGPGQMGENILTRGIDLLLLPTGTRLHLGSEAVVEVTGLRKPCSQLDDLQDGLMAAVLDRDEHGTVIRKAGIMGVVAIGGIVRPHDPVEIEFPVAPHEPLHPV